ncbi:MAG TPA: nitroreductase family deazaflavin-dependent oxidoreductase [Ktedonobacteraceae bacterium]|nr:nitroreductase family deazaflavin-dependent oxidoreductase [Ktedonobacteraceae bacterium]
MPDQKDYNRQVIEEFRANRSQGLVEERPRLLLTTTGAKSGLPRTTPLMYVPHGNNLLVIASNAGAPAHPAWYYNLLAHPVVTVEYKDETFEATANAVKGAEREQLWRDLVKKYSFFADHQQKVSRQIPVVILERNTNGK